MKNFGFGLFDLTRIEGAYGIRICTFWQNDFGRSALFFEISKSQITIDAVFFQISFDRK